MGPGWHQLAAEQENAQEPCLEKEGGEAFISKERRQYVRSSIRVAAPIGTELERHDDAGDHAHPERDREYLDPERRDADVDIASGCKPKALEHGDERAKPDGEGRQQDVPGDYPGKLQSGQNYGI